MRPWRRRQPEPGPEPEAERTLNDAEVHQLALGIAIAAAYVPGQPNAVATAEQNIRTLLADLDAPDLVEVCGDIAAFAVFAFRVNGCDQQSIRDAFKSLALRQASQ